MFQEFANEHMDSYFLLKSQIIGNETGVKRKAKDLDWWDDVEVHWEVSGFLYPDQCSHLLRGDVEAGVHDGKLHLCSCLIDSAPILGLAHALLCFIITY